MEHIFCPVMSFRDLSIAPRLYKTKKKQRGINPMLCLACLCAYCSFPPGINHRRLADATLSTTTKCPHLAAPYSE